MPSSGRRHRSSSPEPGSHRGSEHRSKSRHHRRHEKSDDATSDVDDDSSRRKRHGEERISEDDYYRLVGQFKRWLADDRHKYLDQISSSDSRRYFTKFVKAWNKGKLSSKYYSAPIKSDKTTSSHQWNLKPPTQAEAKLLRNVQEDEDADENGPMPQQQSESKSQSQSRSVMGPQIGPSVAPTQHPLSHMESFQNQREAEREQRDQERNQRKYESSKRRREEKEEEKDNRATGRERILEKRQERRRENAEFANRTEGVGLEVDEDTLMGSGSGDSFQAAIAARDASKNRYLSKSDTRKEEQHAEKLDRQRAYREKESETMAMFKDMAKQRFG